MQNSHLHFPNVTIANQLTCNLLSSTDTDISTLLTIHNRCLPEKQWTEHSISHLLAQPTTYATLVKYRTDVVGFCIFRIVLDEAEILSFGILDMYRNQGVGKTMLAYIIEKCITSKVEKIYLEVAENNDAAIALYKTAGFSTLYRRQHYYKYEGNFIDAVIMQYEVTTC